MTKHKHAEMIIAKANNTELVTLSKHQITGDWAVQNDQQTTDFGECIEYFLCLPQHKEACLHWLNGNQIEISVDGIDDEVNWVGYDLSVEHPKYPLEDFTDCTIQFRVKPKKGKEV